jgi:hypothetical protein
MHRVFNALQQTVAAMGGAGGGRSDKFLVVARKRFAIEGKATASTPMPAAWVNNLVARPDLRMV